MEEPGVRGYPWVVSLVRRALANVALAAGNLGRQAVTRAISSRANLARTERPPLSSRASSNRTGPAPAITSTLLRLSQSYRRAERARSQLAAIVKSSSDAIIGKTLDGTITSWNNGACSLYGYTLEETIGKSIALLVPPDRRHEVGEILAKIRNGQRIDHYETVRRHKSGRLLHVSISVSPIVDGAGRVLGAATIARDISERGRRLEEQRFLLEVDRVLASSLDHETILSGVARLAVNHIADWCAIDLVGEDGAIAPGFVLHRDPTQTTFVRDLHVRCSPRVEGRYCIPSVMQSSEAKLYDDVATALATAAVEDRSYLETLDRSGARSAMVLPMTARGRTLGIIALVSLEGGRLYDDYDLALAEDLAHRVALALDNVRLYQDAQQAIQIRDEFLSVAAHELRTPVTSLHGFAQFALRQLEKDEPFDASKLKQGLKVIDYQSKKLSYLVSQLLDVSAIEGGRLAIDRQLVDLARLMDSVISMARNGANGHTLVLDTPQTMPAFVDPLRIEQVALNLIDNAIKYSPEGGQVLVELTSPEPDLVRLAVRDHGIGIPPEHRERVFDRLFRGHHVDHYSGMGLGLYIAREVVHRHGGEISLEFPEDGGTTSIVTIPTGLRSLEARSDAA